jgi:hypothetical protein
MKFTAMEITTMESVSEAATMKSTAVETTIMESAGEAATMETAPSEAASVEAGATKTTSVEAATAKAASVATSAAKAASAATSRRHRWRNQANGCNCQQRDNRLAQHTILHQRDRSQPRLRFEGGNRFGKTLLGSTSPSLNSPRATSG